MHVRMATEVMFILFLLIWQDVILAETGQEVSDLCGQYGQTSTEAFAKGDKGLISTLVQTAWTCNPENLALAEQIDANAARVRQSRASLLPTASMSTQYEDSRYRLEQNDGNELRQRSASLQGTLRLPLFKPQELQALDISNLEQYDAELALREKHNELAMAILNSVLDLIALIEDIRVLKTQSSVLQEQVYINQRRLEGGLGSVTDISETNLRLHLTQSQWKTRHSEYQQRLIELTQLTGREHLALETLTIEPLLPPIAPKTIGLALDLMMKQNPTLQRAHTQVQLAQENIKLQNRGHWPTLDLVATRSANRYFESSGSSSENSRSNSYVLQFELPLYSGGGVSAQEQEAEAQSRKAIEEQRFVQSNTYSQLQLAYEASKLHHQRITLNERSLSDARKLLNITRKAFKAGNRTNIDVLNAQQQVSDLDGELIKSRVDYLRAQAQIMQLLGELLDQSTLKQFDHVLRAKPSTSEPLNTFGNIQSSATGPRQGALWRENHSTHTIGSPR
jgi:TolC family type I secretion outer membrane protein